MKKTILVTGANGYLASLVYKTNQDKFNWIRMTRKDADLSDPDAVATFLKTQQFDICFHTAANATPAWCNEHHKIYHKNNSESTQLKIA